MPEHVHLLVSEPQRNTLATAVQALKQAVSRQLIGERKHFWQARYYDFNVRTAKKRIEKLRYLHRNPVKRRLVEKPENWEWSSFCNYASGVEGVVETESESLCSVVADCRDSAVMIRRNTRNHRPCLFSIAYCRQKCTAVGDIGLNPATTRPFKFASWGIGRMATAAAAQPDAYSIFYFDAVARPLIAEAQPCVASPGSAPATS